jgi:hypothetical protein
VPGDVLIYVPGGRPVMCLIRLWSVRGIVVARKCEARLPSPNSSLCEVRSIKRSIMLAFPRISSDTIEEVCAY